MKKIILSLVGVVGLTAGSWGQLGGPINFNLGGDYVFHAGGPDTIYDPSVGGVVPTGSSSYTYRSGPVAGAYYGGPIQQYHLTIKDPGNGETPYISGMIEFEVKTDTSKFTGQTRAFNYDPNNGITYMYGEFPEFDPNSYSVTWDGGGFGPGYSLGDDTDESEGAGGAVFAEQAYQLNIGLEFNDGQWTVKQ